MDASYNTQTYAAQTMVELFLELDAIEVSFSIILQDLLFLNVS